MVELQAGHRWRWPPYCKRRRVHCQIGMEYTSALDKAAPDPFFDLECNSDVRCNELEVTLEEWYLVRLSL